LGCLPGGSSLLLSSAANISGTFGNQNLHWVVCTASASSPLLFQFVHQLIYLYMLDLEMWLLQKVLSPVGSVA